MVNSALTGIGAQVANRTSAALSGQGLLAGLADAGASRFAVLRQSADDALRTLTERIQELLGGRNDAEALQLRVADGKISVEGDGPDTEKIEQLLREDDQVQSALRRLAPLMSMLGTNSETDDLILSLRDGVLDASL